MTADIVSTFCSEYPFANHWLDTPHGRIHYVDEGPRDAPVVLLLHGNPTWSFYYRTPIQALRARYRMVAPDHLGCGLSDKPTTFGYRLQDHIENVQRLLDHLALSNVTLVVHDWGGAIGMGVAVAAPDRFTGYTIFNTAAFPSNRIPASINLCRVPGLGAVLIRGFNGFARAALLRCVVHRERLTPEVRAGYLAPYHDWGSRIAHLKFVQDIPMRPTHPSYGVLRRISEGLSRLEGQPMQIIWGGKDFCFDDSFYDEWTRRFPRAHRHYVEDAGHYVVEDAPERITRWLDRFVREVSR